MSERRPTRYRPDTSLRRYERVVVGGSPLRLFRVTPAGAAIVARIVAGEAVADSKLVIALVDAGAVHPEHDQGPFHEADVTTVVPAFQRPFGGPAGAIVVDDASPVPIADATIRLDENVGPAGARNAGLDRVTTPLVAFVDTDVELPTGWLDALLPHFADDRVALVAPRVASRDDGSPVARYERTASPLDRGDEPALIRPGSRVSYVPAAAIVCRVEALRAVGGFDAGLRVGEDVDLVWRLAAAGWRCRYEPGSTVYHVPRSDWRAWATQRIDYGSSAAPLAKRHPGTLAPLRISGWSVAAWLLGAVGRPIAGFAVGIGSAAALAIKLPDVPARQAFRLAGQGNLRAGDQIAYAIRRVWWPLLAIAALRSRIARRVLVAAALAARRPLQLVDDVAYSLGVWRGMLAERTLAPLVPEISSWPGRQTPASAPQAPPATGR